MIVHSIRPKHLKWTIFLLFNPLILTRKVSIMLHYSHWLVWMKMKWRLDLPSLQSVKLGDNAFFETQTFEMSNLTSLQSIVIGDNCFIHTGSFSLIGMNERMKWRIDLPDLQSINLGGQAFYYTGRMVMRSRREYGMKIRPILTEGLQWSVTSFL